MNILPETKRRGDALEKYPGGFEALYRELVLSTAPRMRGLSMYIDGKTYHHPQEIVSDAIARWLACSRKQNKRIVPNHTSPSEIKADLKSTIDSLLKNEGNKLSRNNTTTVEYDDTLLQSDVSVEKYDQGLDEDSLIKFVKLKLGEIPSQVMECILKKEIVAYREIAKELGITDSKVRTAKANIKQLIIKAKIQKISNDQLERQLVEEVQEKTAGARYEI